MLKPFLYLQPQEEEVGALWRASFQERLQSSCLKKGRFLSEELAWTLFMLKKSTCKQWRLLMTKVSDIRFDLYWLSKSWQYCCSWWSPTFWHPILPAPTKIDIQELNHVWDQVSPTDLGVDLNMLDDNMDSYKDFIEFKESLLRVDGSIRVFCLSSCFYRSFHWC